MEDGAKEPGRPQGPTPPSTTTLAPTIRRLRFPSPFVCQGDFDPQLLMPNPTTPGQGQAQPLLYTAALSQHIHVERACVYSRGDPCGRPGVGAGIMRMH